MRLLTCASNEDSNQTAHPPDQSRRYPHEENYHPWVPKMRPVKILIRLRECVVWLSVRPAGVLLLLLLFFFFFFFFVRTITRLPMKLYSDVYEVKMTCRVTSCLSF